MPERRRAGLPWLAFGRKYFSEHILKTDHRSVFDVYFRQLFLKTDHDNIFELCLQSLSLGRL